MMNLQIEKQQIIRQLINIKDAELLKKIKLLIKQDLSANSQQMSIDEFYDRISTSDKAWFEGKIISNQDIKEEVKSWKAKH
ncbi:MAG: hypothetical protein JEY97_05685 [Bacteroidales bacterium]|nr:hypothetical protein [Bacteroidales bacterium]